MKNFNYMNTEMKQLGGAKIVRNVTIRRGKGYKSVTKYNRNKKQFTIKKKLKRCDVLRIKKGKFIPGLFADCRK
uniref:Uncharacterized protein n=1 Tax=viral metagenome TaxID=1070528 RepID=A0A6C0BTX4_9ZZZZ